MKLFFLDDARQNSPSRLGMTRLVAVGGVGLSDCVVGEVERAINALCLEKYEFPLSEELKWSPGRELWMRNNLLGDRRYNFFQNVLQIIRDASGQASVVIEDCNFARATDAVTPELDVVRMCLERICNQCGENPSEGLVITDRALVGRSSDDKFLSNCLENLQSGAGFLRPKALALNVVSTPSKFVRLLQDADIITGATLAAVGGELTFSKPVIEDLMPIYRRSLGRVGGYGVKIHPDYRYANLYHWIFGDKDYAKLNTGWPLPMPYRPYSTDPGIP